MDPGNSPEVIPPMLFLGFSVANWFDRIESSGREKTDGVGTDVITLTKELRSKGTKLQAPGGRDIVQLRLWIDDSGSLRRYESTFRAGKYALSRRGDLLSEKADAGLPKDFFVKRRP
jgi:hypothetical protein